MECEKDIYLQVHHIPEPLKVCACGFLLAQGKLTVVHELDKLLEATFLGHQKASLANSGPDNAKS